MYLMGIDVGSTGCKATITDAYGNVAGSSYREYKTDISKEGHYEISAESIRDEVKKAIRIAAEKIEKGKIKAICASSFGESFIPIDKHGNCLGNPILYIDPRGKEYIESLNRKLGFEGVKISGTKPHEMFSLPKLMWIKDNKPDIYDKIYKIMFIADYVLYMLGADVFSSHSLAARSMAFDVTGKKWSDDILDCADVNKEYFAKPVAAGTVVGKVSSKTASELGLGKDVLLVAGGHDQPCAALGAGVNKGGLAVDGLGTVECITPAFNSPVITRKTANGNFVCVPHVVDNMYVTYAFTMTSGSIVRWYRDTFGQKETEYAKKKGINAYDYIMDNASEKPSGMLLMPHFAGAATPYMDSDSKGALLGLSLDTTKQKFVKGILEGITYEIMVNTEMLDNEGIKINTLRAVGGLAKNNKYMQLKANMMDRVIQTLNVTEAGTAGVAILAGVACGIYKDINDGIEKIVKVKRTFTPDKDTADYYKQEFKKYKKIYSAVKEIYK